MQVEKSEESRQESEREKRLRKKPFFFTFSFFSTTKKAASHRNNKNPFFLPSRSLSFPLSDPPATQESLYVPLSEVLK